MMPSRRATSCAAAAAAAACSGVRVTAGALVGAAAGVPFVLSGGAGLRRLGESLNDVTNPLQMSAACLASSQDAEL